MINLNYHSRNRQQNISLIVIIGILNTITPFSIDMYLPAFPIIAKDLHTTIGDVSLSVSTYFLGFALGQIIYGPLLDRFGRKPPLYVGLIIYILSSLGCAAAPSIEALLLFRFLQALGGSACAVAAMAMVRDFFPVEHSASIYSLMILILGISPLLAPTAGSLVVTFGSWYAIFITLAILVALVLVFTFFYLPEGHQPDRSISLAPKPIIEGFRSILLEPQFYVFSLAGTFSFAGLFVYVAGSPAIFMDEFHVKAGTYGGIFALLSVGFIGGSQLNHLLTRKYTNESIFQATVMAQVIVGILYFTGVANDWYGLTENLVFLFLLLCCAGLTYPNAAAVALRPFSKNAGSASALLGFIQIGIGGLISSGVGMLHFKGSLSTSLIIFLSSSIALAILLAGKKRVACGKA